MKVHKKISILTIIITIILLVNDFPIASGMNINYRTNLPVRIGLFSKDLSDDYLIFLRKGFEDIQKKNEGKVVFTFYDAKSNESTQDMQIDTALNEGIDLLLIDLANVQTITTLIKKIESYNIPVIFFNREPFTVAPIKDYKKALYVGTDSKQAGILQGKMITDAWNNHKESIDKNNDGVLQYVLLRGEQFNKTSIDRSNYSISTIQQAGIKTEQLAEPILNWNEEAAKDTVGSLFLKYGTRIEAIISNDDSMAIGAVEALQKYGYNSGDKSKVIVIVGVDAVPDAQELISKGFILGSPFQDPIDMVNAIYATGMNLVYGKDPVEDTPYKLDDSGAAVRIKFKELTGSMFS